jgi:hypothetical protein
MFKQNKTKQNKTNKTKQTNKYEQNIPIMASEVTSKPTTAPLTVETIAIFNVTFVPILSTFNIQINEVKEQK